MRLSVSAAALWLCAVSLSQADPAAASMRREINVAPQQLVAALQAFSKMTGLNLVFISEDLAARQSPGAVGEFTPDEALRRLLDGTGLSFLYLDAKTITIVPASSAPSPPGERSAAPSATAAGPDTKAQVQEAAPGKGSWNRLRLAQTEPAGKGDASAEKPDAAAAADGKPVQLEEVVVTGSNISGGETASPVLVFTQEDFDRAGAATAEQFLATLPQNFGGGQTQQTALSTLGSGQGQPNFGFGTAVNLRGLGASSTLVLVDGRRLAQGGQAEFTDISMIPLSAVERIEVLTDGASAIYGSDAVGGVVNFIMRRNYQGADSSLRYGESTHGDANEYQASQSAGTTWTGGGGLLSLEYYKRDGVSTAAREFSRRDVTALLLGPRDLVPGQEKYSAYASVHQELSDSVGIFGDAFYVSRPARYTGWDAFGGPVFTGDFYHTAVDNHEYGASLGTSAAIGGSWKVEVTGNGSRNTLESTQTEAGASPVLLDSRYSLVSGEAKATGDLFSLPAGRAKLAAGVSYRDEVYDFSEAPVASIDSSYNVRAAFAELLVPLLGPPPAGSVTSRLALTLAGRYEDYSSFGSTFNPKYGIRWSPVDGLHVRGTYGTSFKAPTGYQLSAFNAQRFAQNVRPAGSVSGPVRSLIRLGNNPDIHQQTAKTWTVGIDWNPVSVPTFKTQLTYFRADYRQRIEDLSNISRAQLLVDPAYANYVIRRGQISDAAFNSLVASIIGATRLTGCVPASAAQCTEPVTDFNAIVDQRLTNLASLRTDGLDWTAAKQLATPVGRLDLNLNASYLFSYSQQATPLAAPLELANTAGNPSRFRLRAAVTWSRDAWSLTSAMNYTDRYTNAYSSDVFGDPLPAAHIASWFTVDLNVTYRPPGNGGWLSGLEVSASATNLFDRDPPYVADGAYGFGYDPANANPLGRVLSALIRKRW